MLQAGSLPIAQEAAVLFSARFAAAAERLLCAHISTSGHLDHAAWVTLLEILYRVEKRADFEALARRYAATFGLPAAPPWGYPEPVAAPGAFLLEGSLSSREQLEGLMRHGRTRTTCAVDMSRVDRIDFAFTPQLAETLRAMHHQGKRVILANIAELHAGLLESFGTEHAVLLRRWKPEARPRAAETGAWAPLPASNPALAAPA